MADEAETIGNTQTLMVDSRTGRVRIYKRTTQDGPGIRERREKASLGLRWCRACRTWLSAGEVSKTGLCKPHRAEDGRRAYARSVGEAYVDRGTRSRNKPARRVRPYVRKSASGPGKIERNEKASKGLKWCRACEKWLPSLEVRKNGLCRPHEAEDARQRYATDQDFRQRRKNKSMMRRGVECLPCEAAEALTELFEGRCAYCPSPATAWDHFYPVSKGGRTVPGNILPACKPCNSKKRDMDPEKWLDIAPDVHVFAIDLLSQHRLVG